MAYIVDGIHLDIGKRHCCTRGEVPWFGAGFAANRFTSPGGTEKVVAGKEW